MNKSETFEETSFCSRFWGWVISLFCDHEYGEVKEYAAIDSDGYAIRCWVNIWDGKECKKCGKVKRLTFTPKRSENLY